MLTFGSLFSGIGGIDLGLERAGMVCKWQVEIDPFCRKVLNKHWPNVPKYEDVRNVGANNLETVDIICGGFPCQPHSLAGKRRGAKDDRNLWPEYRRIIGELHPAWVIGENVPGIKTTILDSLLSDLEGMHYETRTLIIPACAFNAPHRRDRVWIIANADGAQWREKSTEWQRDPGWDVANGLQKREEISGGSFASCETRLMGNAGSQGLAQREGERKHLSKKQQTAFGTSRALGEWWSVEPGVGRVANGIPDRVDRLKSLGNAVVPQIVEWIGRGIIDAASR